VGTDELVDLPSPDERATDAAEHELAISLVLAAADADAAAEDFEGALRWLAFAEQLNFVIPAAYVTRRDEWRRRLDPSLTPDAAATRIDPTFESSEAAMRDLERRVGWLREIERRTEGEMRDQLSALDGGMAELRALTRRAGIFGRRARS
jgi:hypothetical protein